MEEAATCVSVAIKVDEQQPSRVKADAAHEKLVDTITKIAKENGRNINLRTASLAFFVFFFFFSCRGNAAALAIKITVLHKSPSQLQNGSPDT